MFVEGKTGTVFFPSDTLIYGISRDGSKKYNIRTCEHMILGQLTMGAHQTKNAPLLRAKEIKVIGVTNFRFSTPPEMDWEQVFSGLLAFCLLGLGLLVAFLLLLHLSSILPIRS